MGSSISRGTLDVIFILFPFVLSAGLIIMIVICWWKCKLMVGHRGSGRKQSHQSSNSLNPDEEADFGHLINIQEYAENQVGTTIVYADSPGSSFPHPYVYYSDGRITRIVPLTPSPTSVGTAILKEGPVLTISNNVSKNNNNDHLHVDHPTRSSHSNNTNSSSSQLQQRSQLQPLPIDVPNFSSTSNNIGNSNDAAGPSTSNNCRGSESEIPSVGDTPV